MGSLFCHTHTLVVFTLLIQLSLVGKESHSPPTPHRQAVPSNLICAHSLRRQVGGTARTSGTVACVRRQPHLQAVVTWLASCNLCGRETCGILYHSMSRRTSWGWRTVSTPSLFGIHQDVLPAIRFPGVETGDKDASQVPGSPTTSAGPHHTEDFPLAPHYSAQALYSCLLQAGRLILGCGWF